MKILIRISYLGTNYCGYQIQKDQRTVQEALCAAADAVFGVKCDVTGCSRTDSGVHALDFCATVTEHGKGGIDTTIPIDRIPTVFATVLPSDIAVNSAEWVSEEFHPRYDVKYKEYVYKIYNAQPPDPFLADRSWHYPRLISDGAVSDMNKAAKAFVGKYDFCSYMASGSDIKDTTRTVFDAEVTKEGDLITFRVSADGFLYNMVRIFTGTLIAVAEGRISPDDIIGITMAKDRSLAGNTAPARGLYLNKVVY